MPLTDQQRVTLGPLTSTWTAPASCSVTVQQCQTCGQAWLGQTCFASTTASSTNYGVEDNSNCWPPRSSASAKTPPLGGWGFYSPGLACPTGMTSACSATGGGSSGWAVQFSLLDKETAVGCCPQYLPRSNQFCISDHILEAMLAPTTTTDKPVCRPRPRQLFRLSSANRVRVMHSHS